MRFLEESGIGAFFTESASGHSERTASVAPFEVGVSGFLIKRFIEGGMDGWHGIREQMSEAWHIAIESWLVVPQDGISARFIEASVSCFGLFCLQQFVNDALIERVFGFCLQVRRELAQGVACCIDAIESEEDADFEEGCLNALCWQKDFLCDGGLLERASKPAHSEVSFTEQRGQARVIGGDFACVKGVGTCFFVFAEVE